MCYITVEPDSSELTKTEYNEYYRMGFDDSKQLEEKGQVVELNPEMTSVVKYKAYTAGWNAFINNNEIAKKIKF